jgi:beta-mannan synthase
VLFENAMGVVKLWAVIAGILDLKQAQEWVVTTKLGASDARPGTQARAPACAARNALHATPECCVFQACQHLRKALPGTASSDQAQGCMQQAQNKQ